MKTTYEWCAEQVNVDGDIVDTNRYATRAEAEAVKPWVDETNVHVALVRETGDDLHGLTERWYAYLRNGVLDRVFSSCNDDNGHALADGPPVPKRFFK